MRPSSGRERSLITLEFLITSFVVVLIPGTGVIYTVSCATWRDKGVCRGRAGDQGHGGRPRHQGSTVIMAMTFVVFVAYGFIAHAFRVLVIESLRVQKWLRYTFSAAFAGLGARLAASDH